MSSEKFDGYGGNGGAEGQYDFDLEIVNYKKIISNLEKLKSMRDMIIQDMKKHKKDFVPRIHSLISDWEGQYPNFRKILRPKEMDWLLRKCMRNEDVISFVIKSGYKDEPEIDADGKPLLNRSTPLHKAGSYNYNEEFVLDLFKIYDKFDVNYIDESGCTHFHVACKYGLADIVEKFLEQGLDPNILAPISVERQIGEDEEDEEGEDDEEEEYEESDEGVEYILVMPPLHLALELRQRKVAELLLKNGADPNLAAADGSTPLHVLCEEEDYNEAEWFFEVNNELGKTVLVDAQDKMGRTPLQCAVARLYPEFVDVLLVNGADLSNFVFPDETYFGEGWFIAENNFKYILASLFLDIVERLEKRGFELGRNDALAIMKFFAEHGVFEYSTDRIQNLRSNEEFAIQAKKIKIKEDDPNLSLHDLIQLRPDEAAKRITYADFWDWKLLFKFLNLSIEETHKKVCAMHLSETISRRYCRRWALDSLLELTRHKLPTLCSEIIDHLPNEYLWRICTAAAEENS